MSSTRSVGEIDRSEPSLLTRSAAANVQSVQSKVKRRQLLDIQKSPDLFCMLDYQVVRYE